MGGIVDSAWRDWYRAQHDGRWSTFAGTAFENYVQSALKLEDGGFIDPDPMGRTGDWGCDGLSGDGKTLYAVYGSDSRNSSEDKLVSKMKSDFDRGIEKWPTVAAWRFVTNARFGPKATQLVGELRATHSPESDRPMSIHVWHRADDLWTNVLCSLPLEKLDTLFRGVPHMRNVELADMVSLIDSLKDVAPSPGDAIGHISPVSEAKMDYNNIPPAVRLEFNSARAVTWRIGEWFGRQRDPELRDRKAKSFRRVYEDARKSHSDPQEIVEEVYTALGGSDFRLDSKRANAIYAVTTYFFDTCDIFEEPPQDWESGRREA